MTEPLEGMLIAKDAADVRLLPAMANRHGLVAGATGTGKTVTLQVLAEAFSRIGVPVFAADIKGDLSGISQPGGDNPKVAERIEQLSLGDWGFDGTPVMFWDVFGEQGHPVRTTVTEVGPLLLGRMLNLNDIQSAVLTVAFRVADDNGLLLLDIKDLRAMLKYVADNASEIGTTYGNVSAASIGAIQRALLALEEEGGDDFFGEPALDLFDFMQVDSAGRGYVNVLAADRLMQSPRAYSTMLLWLLSELFERLPEAGDLAKPKLVFFFDEAHLLFTDTPPALLTKIEQVVRLIRSKGVGVYFVTQNPVDIPDTVLGQLGNKIQHALRAFTPREQKAVEAMAETFRPNPEVDVETAVTDLKVGEALISVLSADGNPEPVRRALVVPPHGRIGAITPEQRAAIRAASLVAGHYEAEIDRESAHEVLFARAQAAAAAADQAKVNAMAAAAAEKTTAPTAGGQAGPAPAEQGNPLADALFGSTGPRGGRREGLLETMGKSAVRAVGSQVGRQIVRGVLGTITGGKR
ncbi:MAG: helicase HerA-like domain-containing protein [Coriobacteriia bacterium]|nr:helicase HerA-like domain-containing protein [Coriobacteriia bacterium]